MCIRQIVYVSSGAREYSSEEVEKITDTGSRNNAQNDLTGVLLYYDGNFMQLLEGPADAVAETYERIVADTRHTGILPLQDSMVEERSFPDYRMGFRSIAKDLLATSSDLFEKLPSGWGVKPGANVDEKLVILFRTFFTINSGKFA
jgi:hypothetical protein